MTRFSDWMIGENVQVFWAAMQRGEFITDAAEQAGTYRKKGARLLVASGGVRPRRGRDLKGRCLSFMEREEIALGRAAGEWLRSIAARLGRSPSTISRELVRNHDLGRGYRATTAHALAYDRACRPKPATLYSNVVLRGRVEDDLEKKYSPEQIAGRLGADFPDDPEMCVAVSPERLASVPTSPSWAARCGSRTIHMNSAIPVGPSESQVTLLRRSLRNSVPSTWVNITRHLR